MESEKKVEEVTKEEVSIASLSAHVHVHVQSYVCACLFASKLCDSWNTGWTVFKLTISSLIGVSMIVAIGTDDTNRAVQST